MRAEARHGTAWTAAITSLCALYMFRVADSVTHSLCGHCGLLIDSDALSSAVIASFCNPDGVCSIPCRYSMYDAQQRP